LGVRIYRKFFHGKIGPPLESDVRRSYRSMARKIGIDEVTIRNRIKRRRSERLLERMTARAFLQSRLSCRSPLLVFQTISGVVFF
jgi:hypothetical protein